MKAELLTKVTLGPPDVSIEYLHALRLSMQRVLETFEPGRKGGERAQTAVPEVPSSSFFNEGTQDSAAPVSTPPEIDQPEPASVQASGLTL